MRRVVSGAAALSLLALVVLAIRSAPYSRKTEYCLHCGRTRVSASWCYIPYWKAVEENETSRWVDALYPGHSAHEWAFSSSEQRGWFFGPAVCADGGPCVPIILYYLKPRIGDEKTTDYFEQYKQALELEGDQRRTALRELYTELDLLLNPMD
jgi:hypothetical protein